MLYAAALLLLPPLLVFAVYHLNLWIDLAGVRRRAFWLRVALASGEAHLLIVIGLAGLMWLDYRSRVVTPDELATFGVHVLTRTDLIRLLWILDPLAMGVLSVGLSVASGVSLDAGAVLAITLVAVLALGTLQWCVVGAGLGFGFGHLWTALRSGEDDLPDWF